MTKRQLPHPRAAQLRWRAIALLVALPLAALACGALAHDPFAPARWLAVRGIAAEGGGRVERSGVVLQANGWDCGPAALANLLALLGRPTLEVNTLARLAGTTGQGTSLEQLILAARRVGLPLRLLVTDPARASLPTPPYLAWVERRHFVLVADRKAGDTLVIVDPAVGRYRIPAAAFRVHWSGAAALVDATPGDT